MFLSLLHGLQGDLRTSLSLKVLGAPRQNLIFVGIGHHVNDLGCFFERFAKLSSLLNDIGVSVKKEDFCKLVAYFAKR